MLKNQIKLFSLKGTTDGINIVASSWAENQLKKGDEILITTMDTIVILFHGRCYVRNWGQSS